MAPKCVCMFDKDVNSRGVEKKNKGGGGGLNWGDKQENHDKETK